LVSFIAKATNYFYEDPANSMSYDSGEGGYMGDFTDDISEKIFDSMGLDCDKNLLSSDYSFQFSFESIQNQLNTIFPLPPCVQKKPSPKQGVL